MPAENAFPKAQKKGRPLPGAADPIADDRPFNFGPVKGHVAYYLPRLLRTFTHHFKSLVGELDIQARDVGALFLTGRNPGITPTQLGAALYLDAAQVTGMLNSFVLKGWIERRVSSTDGRSRTLYLTNAGQRLLAQLEPMVGEIGLTFVEGILTEEEAHRLTALLAKLFAGRQIKTRADSQTANRTPDRGERHRFTQ